MEYPRLVFISPGALTCNGGTYDHEIVQDEKEHKAAISAGFSDSVPEALESADRIRAEDDPIVPAKRGRPPKVS